MVSIPPYLPSLSWYAVWYAAMRGSRGDESSIACANRLLGIRGKDFARTEIRGVSAPSLLLSAAVAGGSHALLRSGNECEALISLHGDWPRIHLGALEASYGRAPFFSHLIQPLRAAFEPVPATLAELNRTMHGIVISMIHLAAEPARCGGVIYERGKELSEACIPELSALDALMRFGPEVSLLLEYEYLVK